MLPCRGRHDSPYVSGFLSLRGGDPERARSERHSVSKTRLLLPLMQLAWRCFVASVRVGVHVERLNFGHASRGGKTLPLDHWIGHQPTDLGGKNRRHRHQVSIAAIMIALLSRIERGGSTDPQRVLGRLGGLICAALSASPCWSLEPACGICSIAPNFCSLQPWSRVRANRDLNRTREDQWLPRPLRSSIERGSPHHSRRRRAAAMSASW